MAKSFVQVSLATKLRVLFGVAVLCSIAAALMVPWYFMELLAEQGLQRPAAELTRLRLNEWLVKHKDDKNHASTVAELYLEGRQFEGRTGPSFVPLSADLTPRQQVDGATKRALKAFVGRPGQKLAIIPTEDEDGREVYRCFRAVRVNSTCLSCHGQSAPVHMQFQPGQLAAVIDLTMPGVDISSPIVWLIRGSFIVGGTLAVLIATVIFAIITHRLILRPIRSLRNVADRATEGDLAVRSDVDTGDELQRLGESFNEMLTAITDQHGELRQANRALDLKLSELAEANVTLFQANKVKTEFLTNVSHELRTPLNSIIGFADLLNDSDNEQIGRYGHNIGSSARHLLTLINDLLDMARLEAGRAEVRPVRVSVSDTCQTLLALMQPQSEQSQLTLSGSIDDDLPMIVTDPGKCQQILYNLLANAIKFTPAGGEVTLRATTNIHQRSGEEVHEIAVAVSDTGPGVMEADQEHIFEKFFQVDPTLTKKAAGAGLGLAISRELAQLLQGRLTLESTPGHGATFTLFLPIEPGQFTPKDMDKVPLND